MGFRGCLRLDVLASAKQVEGSFKVPRPKVSSMMASIDEDVKNSSLADQDDVGSGVSSSGQNKSRKYRDSSGSKTFDSDLQKVSLKKNDLLDMLLPHIQRLCRLENVMKLSARIICPKRLTGKIWKYLIRRRMAAHKLKYPDEQMISLGIGDITEPIPEVVTSAMAKCYLELVLGWVKSRSILKADWRQHQLHQTPSVFLELFKGSYDNDTYSDVYGVCFIFISAQVVNKSCNKPLGVVFLATSTRIKWFSSGYVKKI
ncbi:LL-diaminopimelate aminotransferase, chloroplastic [Artemisia annua]|uniref:LL-diaminopimelate aminotransferase, chloroplastic n=1 Tax=Artemisia annua TaxID=35608 RepID=A0A2U1NKA5_ARTAN|nr:LL-diaminopimelate aminotransferase, chloroplastic [Artemisia annua]